MVDPTVFIRHVVLCPPSLTVSHVTGAGASFMTVSPIFPCVSVDGHMIMVGLSSTFSPLRVDAITASCVQDSLFSSAGLGKSFEKAI
jgi:hypothetical protein